MKLLVASPSNRDICPSFMVAMMNLHLRLHAIGVNGKKCEVIMHLLANSSLLSAARQNALDAAIKENCTHLLMLDDDMVFPSDVVDKLTVHDLDFVAANYVSKGPTGKPTAVGLDGKIYSCGKTGIEEVGWVGLGCCLLKLTDEIKAIPRPHFEVMWLEETSSYLGEDYYFCEKLRHNGIKLHVDHDVSQEIGHVGDYKFTESGLKLFEDKND